MSDVADTPSPDPAVSFVTYGGAELHAEVDELVRVYTEATDASPTDRALRRDIIRRHSTYPDAAGILALVDDRTAGFCYGIRGRPGQWWYDRVSAALDAAARRRWLDDCFIVCELAVEPAHQGRGVGRELVERVLQSPEARRRRTVLLSAEESNPVDHLYRSLGFHEVLGELHFASHGPAYRVMGRVSALP